MKETAEIVAIRKEGKNRAVYVRGIGEVLLTAETIRKYALAAGGLISVGLLEKIRLESDHKRAADYVASLLARKSYSVNEIRTRLERKGFEDLVIKRTIKNFKERGVMDDSSLARQLAETIILTRPGGEGFIIGRLCQRGIARRLAEMVVNELTAGIGDEELAYRALRNRWRHFSQFDLETARGKAYNYLSRRAISYQPAKKAFERIVKENAEAEDIGD
jgi:SOS response regulatory protein OraA/RecX